MFIIAACIAPYSILPLPSCRHFIDRSILSGPLDCHIAIICRLLLSQSVLPFLYFFSPSYALLAILHPLSSAPCNFIFGFNSTLIARNNPNTLRLEIPHRTSFMLRVDGALVQGRANFCTIFRLTMQRECRVSKIKVIIRNNIKQRVSKQQSA